jgi:endonuclease/exonuclease/phosphatase family metal-dependent hydrolase
MKVATYNLRVDTDYDQDWQWPYRADKVLALIDYHDWEIFCVQEIRPTQVADLAKLSDYVALTVERDGDGTGEGIGIYYKKDLFSKIESGSFWLSLTPDVPSIHPDAEYKRLCLWTVLKDRGNHEFLVIDTHLDNISEIARFEGMKVILEQLAEKITNLPVLLMGDLNAEAFERVHDYLQTIFVNGKEQSEKGHYGPKGSYQNFDYQMPWDQLEEIDYIYTKGFRVVKTGCLTDSCDGRFPSDHFPLEAEVQLNEQ